MSRPWFDSDTGAMLFDRYVPDMPSFRRITEDLVVTDAELAAQTERVASLVRQLEANLSPEQRDLVTDVLSEMAVLNVLQLKRLDADG